MRFVTWSTNGISLSRAKKRFAEWLMNAIQTSIPESTVSRFHRLQEAGVSSGPLQSSSRFRMVQGFNDRLEGARLGIRVSSLLGNRRIGRRDLVEAYRDRCELESLLPELLLGGIGKILQVDVLRENYFHGDVLGRLSVQMP